MLKKISCKNIFIQTTYKFLKIYFRYFKCVLFTLNKNILKQNVNRKSHYK